MNWKWRFRAVGLRLLLAWLLIFGCFRPIHTSILIIILSAAFIIYKEWSYRNSAYYKATENSYITTRFDKGKFGEYLIYEKLAKHEKNGAKFLFNVYVPKNDTQTTEIDVLMVSSVGVFVFESKNYSGWIYGDENRSKWHQTFKTGRKENFYNPIMQNRTHIRFLNELLGCELPTYSVIVFSERCTLKSINVLSDVYVIQRNDLKNLVDYIYESEEDLLAESDINLIYETLYPYTQVNDETKAKHIDNINNSIKR